MELSVEQITSAYELEKLNHRPVTSAEEIPFIFEDITPEWLTSVLCNKHPGAKVVSHRLDSRDDGSSNRRRIFIKYNEAGKFAGLPEQVFCKGTQGLKNRITLGWLGVVEGEIHFYNKIRPSLPIEAPIGCFANFNAALNSIVIMRDLGDETIFCTHTTDITFERAKSQLRLLATLHGSFLESPELNQTLAIFPTYYPQYFNKQDSFPHWEEACDQAFDIAKDIIPARLFARRKEVWPATRKSAERHLYLPHTIVHCDVHLRNWYIASNGEMGLSDWQAIGRGHWSRDVTYALVTSLTVEHRRQWLEDLLRYYVEQLQQASGRSIPFKGVLDECRRQLLTVLSVWTITLNPAPDMPDMQPRDSTIELVRRIATAIDDLDALDSFN